MSLSQDDFACLLTRARTGDDEALTQLARAYEAEIRMVARVRLGTALRPYVDSMDLVQSVHRSLMVGLRQDRYEFKGPDQLVALAVTMVRRKAARHWRKQKRQIRPVEGAEQENNLPQLLASLSCPNADPAQQAQINDALGHFCKSLSDTERKLLQMRLDGYSTADAARQMGLDPDVLRVQLSRLRQKLRSRNAAIDWL